MQRSQCCFHCCKHFLKSSTAMLSRAASVRVEPLQRQQNTARRLGFWVRISLGRGCLPLVSFVCLQVQVSASGAGQSFRGILPSVVCPMSVVVKLHKGRTLNRSATSKEDMLRRMDNIQPINIIDWIFISSLEWFCYHLSWLSCPLC
jgi:hypothetical protein